MAKKINKDSINIPSAYTKDQTVFRRELHVVRDVLQSEIRAHDKKTDLFIAEMDEQFVQNSAKIDAGFAGVNTRFVEMDNKIDVGFAKTDARFNEMDNKIDVGFAKTDARFKEMDNKIDVGFAKVDARFNEMDAKNEVRFSSLESKIELLTSEIRYALVLFEEQNQNNRIVLEGHQLLWQKYSADQSKFKSSLSKHGISLD